MSPTARRRRVDLAALARGVVAELAPLAAAKRIDLGLNADSRLCSVDGDAEALRDAVVEPRRQRAALHAGRRARRRRRRERWRARGVERARHRPGHPRSRSRARVRPLRPRQRRRRSGARQRAWSGDRQAHRRAARRRHRRRGRGSTAPESGISVRFPTAADGAASGPVGLPALAVAAARGPTATRCAP